MKNNYLLCVFFAMMVHAVHANATVFTSVKDGDFSQAATWGVNEFHPSDDDEYIVSHTIRMDKGEILASKITINANGRLLNPEKCDNVCLTVSHSMENNGYFGYLENGTLDNDFIEQYGRLSLVIKDGSLTNNGTFRISEMIFKGKTTTLSSSQPLEVNGLSAGTEVTVLSDLCFLNTYIHYYNGNNPTFLMGKHNLSFTCTYKEEPKSWSMGYMRDVNIVSEDVLRLDLNNTGMVNCKIKARKVILNSDSYYFFRGGNIINADVVFASGKANVYETAWPEDSHLVIYGNVDNHVSINAEPVLYTEGKPSEEDKKNAFYAGEISVHGNLYNYGKISFPDAERKKYDANETTVNLMTLGDTLSVFGRYDCDLTVRQFPSWLGYNKGEGPLQGCVRVDGDLTLIDAKLSVYTQLLVEENASVYVSDNYNPISICNYDGSIQDKGEVVNYGHVSLLTPIGYMGSTYDSYLSVHATIPGLPDYGPEAFDHILFEEFGSAHPNLPTSTSRWWRIHPVTDDKNVTGELKLYYDERWLNGQDENKLRLYVSQDDGKTWDILSVGENFKLDTEANTFTLSPEYYTDEKYRIHGYGDFVLSSGDGSVPTESNVKIEVVASKQFRVGAPNRFAIHVHNITDKPTEDLQLTFNCTDSLRISGIEFPLEDGSMYAVPLDSLRDPENDPLDAISDKCQMFFIPSLEPYEDFWFNVVCYGVRDKEAAADRKRISDFIRKNWQNLEEDFGDPEFWESLTNDTGNGQKADWAMHMYEGLRTGQFRSASFVTSVKKDVVEALVVESVNSVLDLKGEEKKNWERAFGTNLSKERRERRQEAIRGLVDGQFSTKGRIKSVITTALDLVPIGKAINVAGKIAEVSWSLKEGLRRQIWYWIYDQVGLFGVRTKDGNFVDGSRIYSWDPNEMVGPSGYGPKNAIKETGRMNYTIKFENKKEATAPAYRIRIKDVLDTDVFDPSTVEFGHTSHSGSKYNWKMTREGNVLTWDIEGIELMPNVTPPEGEGYVTFSVKTKDNLPSGTAISNSADIIFDENPAIRTNTYTNVVDTEAPTSRLDFWNYISSSPTVMKIATYAEDAVSGIRSIDVYLSENGDLFKKVMSTNGDGPVEINVSDVTSTCRLYTIATDWVGNIQTSYDIVNVNDYANGIKPLNSDAPATTKGVLYDMSGRRVTTPTKGVYILDGKKVIFE